jgi:poly-gamma-glutamate capsule biosynthesis protein CapA/YwtB (metallophosphatase superfamily)
MKKILPIIAVVLFTSAFAGYKLIGNRFSLPAQERYQTPAEQKTPPVKNTIEPAGYGIADTLRIIGVGDMMLGTNFPVSPSYLAPDDGKTLLDPVKNILSASDITFGNLEGCILSEGGTPKSCTNPAMCYAFRMPNHYAGYFREAGFDLISIANNHIGDFGEAGRRNTVDQLKGQDIAFAGLSSHPYTIVQRNGIRYGLCAFAPNEGTVSINDLEGARALVKKVDALCDVLIVSFHGGAEGAGYRHITRKNELFLGENRGNPYQFARVVIDAGADLVFGHGPHVTRAVDIYKNRFIAYSMGNFATYGRFNLKGPAGIAPIVSVRVSPKGDFIDGQIIPVKQVGEGGPLPDSSGAVIQEIISLTKEDIPECTLRISFDGKISLK